VSGRTGLAVLAFALGVHVLGCDHNPCDYDNISAPPTPPTITVVNASTGQAICDATVLATCTYFDAGFPLITMPSTADASSSDCEYGVTELWADGGLLSVEPLEYSCTLQVSKTGFQTTVVPNVAPQGGGRCTRSPSELVEIKLQPG
jgi:hypothetical protein